MQRARLEYGAVKQGQHHGEDQPHADGPHAVKDIRKPAAVAEALKAG